MRTALAIFPVGLIAFCCTTLLSETGSDYSKATALAGQANYRERIKKPGDPLLRSGYTRDDPVIPSGTLTAAGGTISYQLNIGKIELIARVVTPEPSSS